MGWVVPFAKDLRLLQKFSDNISWNTLDHSLFLFIKFFFLLNLLIFRGLFGYMLWVWNAKNSKASSNESER